MSKHDFTGFETNACGTSDELARLMSIHQRCLSLFDQMAAVARDLDNPEFEKLSSEFREIAGRKG